MNDFEKAVKERTDEESMKEKTKKLCCANCKLRIRLSEKNLEEYRVICPKCGVVIHLCKVFD